MKKIKLNREGFTIIEVMIVLAIAGLIMLIVFLAVPALQRNAHNTQYRSDAANYLSAVNEWMSNNNGKVPASAADVTGVNSLAKLGVMTAPAGITAGGQSTAVAIGQLQLNTGAKCDPAVVGNSLPIATRSVAIRYSVENSAGGPVPQCID
jgi:prepilin-type N-terminal cleavage/methylation domain-containing protein